MEELHGHFLRFFQIFFFFIKRKILLHPSGKVTQTTRARAHPAPFAYLYVRKRDDTGMDGWMDDKPSPPVRMKICRGGADLNHIRRWSEGQQCGRQRQQQVCVRERESACVCVLFFFFFFLSFFGERDERGETREVRTHTLLLPTHTPARGRQIRADVRTRTRTLEAKTWQAATWGPESYCTMRWPANQRIPASTWQGGRRGGGGRRGRHMHMHRLVGPIMENWRRTVVVVRKLFESVP